MRPFPESVLAVVLALVAGDLPRGQEEREQTVDAPSAAREPAPLVVSELAGAGRVARSGRVFLAASPTPEALSAFARERVRTVVDLRGAMDAQTLDVAGHVRRLGLAYVRLPLSGPTVLPDEILDEARRLLDRHRDDPRSGGLLLFGRSAGPAATAWLTARVLDEGVDWSTALGEARLAGSTPGDLEEVARLYVLGAGKQELGRWKERIRSELPSVRRIGVAELATTLKGEGPKPLLLDVREPAEFAISHLPDARCAPGVSEAVSFLEAGPRDREVVVYCSIGYRSARLAKELGERGFTNVRNLEGSIFEWANTGHPVLRRGQTVREVHPYDRKWGLLLDRELWSWTAKR